MTNTPNRRRVFITTWSAVAVDDTEGIRELYSVLCVTDEDISPAVLSQLVPGCAMTEITDRPLPLPTAFTP